MQEGAVLEMRGICKYFPGVRALQNVDFTLREGEIHALMEEVRRYPYGLLYQTISEIEDSFDIEGMLEAGKLHNDLAQAISRIQGAGDATVLLSLDQGVERVLAEDRVEEQGEKESSQEQTTVICDGEDGEEVVLLTQYYPSFRGALVVCPGGDDPQVQLAITQAVSALTGLGSDRITICAGD